MEKRFDVMYFDDSNNKHLICGITAEDFEILRREFDIISFTEV